jgi:glycosyltransferase involved in cell wall biosynthesis
MMFAHSLGYLLFIILARILSVEEYGEIVTLTASIYVLAVIVRSIQSQAAQIMSDKTTSMQGEALGFVIFRRSLPWTAIGAALIFGLFWLTSSQIANYLQLSSPVLVVALGAYLASYFILPVPRGLLLGLGKLHYAGWDYLIEPIARLGVALALILSPIRTVGVLLGYFAGKVAAYLFAAWPFVRARHEAVSIPVPTTRTWRVDKQFLLAVIVNSSLMALGSIDPFVIKHFFTPTVAGSYSVAFLLGRVIMLSTMAASWVTFSTTVRLRIHDPAARKPLLRGLVLGGSIAGLVTLVYWLAPDLVVIAVGGEAYKAASGFVGLVGLEMMLFTLIAIQAYYHIAVRHIKVLIPFGLALVMEVTLLSAFHATPTEVIHDTLATLGVLLIWTSYLSLRALSPRKETEQRPRLCVVTRSDYRSDPRPRREAEALMDAGWEVEVFHDPGNSGLQIDEFEGARIFAVPRVNLRQRSSIAVTLINYVGFFLFSAIRISWQHLRSPYRVVHVHNMPDFLVFLAAIPRLMGAQVILDIHDLMPELASLRFGVSLDHPLVRLFQWIERFSTSFATHVITAGEPFKSRLTRSGTREEKITSIMNTPDPGLFIPQNGTGRANGGFILSYHGSLLEYNSLEVVLGAMALGRPKMPDLEFHIYGQGRELERLRYLSKELGLAEQVRFQGHVPLDRIPSLISSANLGVAPQCRSAFTSLNYPTKVFEYVAMGIPVVMSWSPALAELFSNIPGIFFAPEDSDELADVIWQFYSSASRRQSVASLQKATCRSISWPNERKRLVNLVNSFAALPEAESEFAAA